MFISFYVFYAFTLWLRATTDTGERWRQTHSGKALKKQIAYVFLMYERCERYVCIHMHVHVVVVVARCRICT